MEYTWSDDIWNLNNFMNLRWKSQLPFTFEGEGGGLGKANSLFTLKNRQKLALAPKWALWKKLSRKNLVKKLNFSLIFMDFHFLLNIIDCHMTLATDPLPPYDTPVTLATDPLPPWPASYDLWTFPDGLDRFGFRDDRRS